MGDHSRNISVQALVCLQDQVLKCIRHILIKEIIFYSNKFLKKLTGIMMTQKIAKAAAKTIMNEKWLVRT